jgi:tetratricopeptide (TPR) repeat protein/HAMP domain-containing protein
MSFFKTLTDSIYFNYLSFGSLLAFIFTFLLGLYLITLKGKSKSTLHLGLGFFFMGLFNISYVIAAMFYSPYAAFHRWASVGFVMPAILHFTQWIFYFPEDSHQKARRFFQYSQWAVAILTTGIFIVVSLKSGTKFHFTGHYWDFDAEDASRLVGIVIFSYVIICSIIGFWKTYHIKNSERWAILQVTISLIIASAVPAFMNILSRDGMIDRGTFLTYFVLMTVLGFFFVVIVFINHTHDRTTFMAKIVGITLVTFLLLMQGMSFITMADREEEYDNLREENAERYLEGGAKNKDILYKLELDSEGVEFSKDGYDESLGLDLPLVKVDFLNNIVYEKILALSKQNKEGFREELKLILSESHEEFSGYKSLIYEFLEKNQSLSDEKLKSEIFSFFTKINTNTFVNNNRISNLPDESFCKNIDKFLNKNKELSHFKEPISKHLSNCKWDGFEMEISALKKQVIKYFRYFKPQMTRHYRKSLDGKKHFVSYIKYFPETKTAKEVGFSYLAYREYMHPAAKSQMIILVIVLFIILLLYPLFFKGSLMNPLQSLLRGVAKVNEGNLEVEVRVRVEDEIGYLSHSFNSMVESIRQARKELQDYAENLEEKVKIRTKEVQEKMEEVQKLKIQQDGDYFLTSLLAKPLFFNANKSSHVSTEFIIHQKKRFEFKNKTADLGGDICITGNLKFGTNEKFTRYTMAMNGDAMGKSMQGAGGSLVMGVVMNSIMARSAANKKILKMTAEQWLTDVYNEINSVFKSFNGTMVISATVALIDDETGEMLYWNAEHPFTILYRDESAKFIEEGLCLRKLGLDSEYEFEVKRFQLVPGDTVLLASDGRDDIDLTPNEPFRTINEDENLILKIVEEARCSIPEIEKIILSKGDITDDISFLKIEYKHNFVGSVEPPQQENPSAEQNEFSNQLDINKVYQHSKELYQTGQVEKALELLSNAYSVEQNNLKLNKLLGLLSLKGRDYDKAISVLTKYLSQDPDTHEIWYYLSLAQKKIGDYVNSLETAKKAYEMNPNFINNIINLSDLYRLNGKYEDAKFYSDKVMTLDSENKNAKRLKNVIENKLG